jgi:putative hemolysin
MKLTLIIFLLAILLLLNAWFSSAETALISLRQSQVEALSKKSKRGRVVAKLLRDPNRFLSAVQIGITFVGFFSAAFGAAELAPYLTSALTYFGIKESVASTISVVLLTFVISYVSVIVAELVPKRLALAHAEKTSLNAAKGLDRFATILKPLIWFLSLSTSAIAKLFGVKDEKTEDKISNEELKILLTAKKSIQKEEKQILEEVFEAEDTYVSELLIPRNDVEFVKGESLVEDVWIDIRKKPYSRYPVIGESFDDIIGFVHIRDLINAVSASAKTNVAALARDILIVPSTNRLIPTLTLMRKRHAHIAVVADEYGGTDGIITLEDLLEELIGDIQDEYDLAPRPEKILYQDGSMSIDGQMSLEDFKDETDIELQDAGGYETVAGFMFAELGKMAKMGDEVHLKECTLRVIELDGNRITRVRVVRNKAKNETASKNATHETSDYDED